MKRRSRYYIVFIEDDGGDNEEEKDDETTREDVEEEEDKRIVLNYSVLYCVVCASVCMWCVARGVWPVELLRKVTCKDR